MILYSHSRISSFETCPRKYAFRYVEKVPAEWESVEAFLGKRVHEILERLYHHLRRAGRPPSLSQVQQRFRREWRAFWHPKVRIVREERDAESYLAEGESHLAQYYRANYPFDDGETVALEHKVEIALAGRRCFRLRGVIDRVVRSGPGRYEVHDYKTGRTLPTLKKLAKDRQLALYQIGIEQSFEDAAEVELVWHYLAFNQTLRVRHERDQIEALQAQTIDRIEEIESTSEFPARPSPLCRWCEYADRCPARPSAQPPEPQLAAELAPTEAACPRGQLSLF